MSQNPFNHTLIHELGHSLGLTHTFETYAGANTEHSGQNNGLYDNSVFKRLVYAFDTDTFSLEYGDGIMDTPLDPFGSYYVASLDGGGGSFSSFNWTYEGEEVLLFDRKQPTGDMFTDSSFLCKQLYDVGGRFYYFDCGVHTRLFDNSVINNVMSYWYKIPGDEHFTTGQVDKMLETINKYPEIKD